MTQFLNVLKRNQVLADLVLADGDIIVGNASNVAVGVTPTGDISITNAGVFSIVAGVIINADVKSDAAIAYSKLNLSTSILDTDISTTADLLIRSITWVIDGGGSTITTGISGDLEIPFACTIDQVTMLADQSGSIVVDIWKDTFANFPPLDADSITAAAVPTITTDTDSQDSTLTGWTTGITAGDTLRFNVDSVTTIQKLTLSLEVHVT